MVMRWLRLRLLGKLARARGGVMDLGRCHFIFQTSDLTTADEGGRDLTTTSVPESKKFRTYLDWTSILSAYASVSDSRGRTGSRMRPRAWMCTRLLGRPPATHQICVCSVQCCGGGRLMRHKMIGLRDPPGANGCPKGSQKTAEGAGSENETKKVQTSHDDAMRPSDALVLHVLEVCTWGCNIRNTMQDSWRGRTGTVHGRCAVNNGRRSCQDPGNRTGGSAGSFAHCWERRGEVEARGGGEDLDLAG